MQTSPIELSGKYLIIVIPGDILETQRTYVAIGLITEDHRDIARRFLLQNDLKKATACGGGFYRKLLGREIVEAFDPALYFGRAEEPMIRRGFTNILAQNGLTGWGLLISHTTVQATRTIVTAR